MKKGTNVYLIVFNDGECLEHDKKTGLLWIGGTSGLAVFLTRVAAKRAIRRTTDYWDNYLKTHAGSCFWSSDKCAIKRARVQ